MLAIHVWTGPQSAGSNWFERGSADAAAILRGEWWRTVTALTLHGDALKIALNAPPVDRKANESLIAFIAEKLSLPRARVALVAGATGRSKVLRVTGKSAAEVQAALLPDIDC